MHYALEMMSDFTLDSLENAKDMTLNKYGYSLSDEEIQDIYNRVKTLVKSEEFQTLIDGERYKEQAIRYKNDLRYIDLLVKKEETSKESLFAQESWIVIDYKSSTSYSKHHLKQVRYYVNAVKEITGETVEGYICYILENEVRLVKV